MKVDKSSERFNITNLPNVSDNTKYMAGLFLLLVVLTMVYMYFYRNQVSGFANMHGSLKDKLNALDIIMFTSYECKYCPDQLKKFEEQGLLDTITVKNVSDGEHVKKEAIKYGVIGFPFFVSLKNRTSTVGFTEDINSIVDFLQPVPPGPGQVQGSAQSMKNMKNMKQGEPDKIFLLTRGGCGWCTKAKEDISKKNVPQGVVSVVEASSDEGRKVIEKFKLKIEGVPVYVSGRSGETIVGFKPIEEVRKQFKI